jgi:hypothetical protein
MNREEIFRPKMNVPMTRVEDRRIGRYRYRRIDDSGRSGRWPAELSLREAS